MTVNIKAFSGFLREDGTASLHVLVGNESKSFEESGLKSSKDLKAMFDRRWNELENEGE